MKQILALAVLAALTSGLHQDYRQVHAERNLFNAETDAAHTCKENIQNVLKWNYTAASVKKILNGPKTKYIDEDFPVPKNKSAKQDALFWPAPFLKAGDTTKADATTTFWARAYTTSWLTSTTVMADNVDFNDVEQGQIGDCYFLDAISSLANTDYRLLTQIITEKKNPQGIFAVNAYIRGIPRVILVDDFIPFYGKYFAQYNFILPYAANQANDGGVWAMMLEKVWAKTNANYNNINAGNAGEVWSFFAGIPSKYYRFNDVSTINGNAETLWQLTNDAMVKNQIASLGTGSTAGFGLVPSHAYTVLGTFNYTDDEGAYHLLFQIRNPWGKDVYNTETMNWDDNDTSTWSLNATNFLPFQNNSQDGVFFMEASQAITAFDGLQVGYYFDNYLNNYLDVKGDKGTLNTFNITISEAGNWYLGMELYNPRMWPNKCKNTTTAIMYIYSPQGSNLGGYAVADYNNFAHFNFPNLAVGTYKMTVKVTWAGAPDQKDFTVRAYGPGNATIKGKSPATGDAIVGKRNPIIGDFTSKGGYNNNNGARGYNGTQVQYNNNTEEEDQGGDEEPTTPTETGDTYSVYGDSTIGQNLIDTIIAQDLSTATYTNQQYFEEWHKQLNTPVGGRSGIDYFIHFEANPTYSKSDITLSFTDPGATIAYTTNTVNCYP